MNKIMPSDWFPLWAWLSLGCAALVALWWYRYSRMFARRGLPYVAPVPFVGNMLDMALSRKSFVDVLVDVYRRFEPHPYAGVFNFTTPLVMLRDPELIRAVTIKDFDHFTDHIGFLSADVNPLLQRMLISLKGKEWHDMRATLSPAFTSAKMKNMFVLMEEIGHQMIDYLMKETSDFEASSSKDDSLTLEMKDFFTRITNDVIATTAFGVKVDSLSEPNNTFYQMGRNLTRFNQLVAFGYFICPKLMQWLGIPFLDQKSLEYLRCALLDTIKTREKQGTFRPDVIQLLMQARHGELTADDEEKNGTDEGKRKVLTDDDMVAQAMLFFFAGFDTVSTALTFSSYLLATHEDVQRKLQQEVDDVMSKSGGQPSYEQLMGCQYLDMVVSEVLRMYSPGTATDRKCVRSYRLPATEHCPGVELRPGDGVWVPTYAIHRDPNYFSDPERFDPERFSPENRHLIKPFTYLPFGVGPRICIAQRFGLMETKVMLAFLLWRFSLQVAEKTPVPLQIAENNIALSVKGGAWIGIRRRS